MHSPLRIGSPVRSAVSVTGSRDLVGRSGGAMTIMTTTRTYEQDGNTALTEEQDIVYREPKSLASPTSAPVQPQPTEPAEVAAPAGVAVDIDSPYLFRFSALTYNAHRIHYDVDYCRHVEGYDALVVHGPLQALLMTEAARRSAPAECGSFDFRLTSPLLLGQGLFVLSAPDDQAIACSITTADGRVTATGTWRPQ